MLKFAVGKQAATDAADFHLSTSYFPTQLSIELQELPSTLLKLLANIPMVAKQNPVLQDSLDDYLHQQSQPGLDNLLPPNINAARSGTSKSKKCDNHHIACNSNYYT